MMRIALFASLLVPVADTMPDPGPPAPAAAEVGPGRSDGPLPLDAMRHHQPTAADVQQRERQLGGEATPWRRQDTDQREIDDIYQDVMRWSAPSQEPYAGVSPSLDQDTRVH